MKSKVRVGILAFQGDFAKHQQAFARLSCEIELVKSAKQLEKIDCLVIPGGESSVIYRFIESTQMREPIKKFAADHPVWGACAGMILLATEIINDTTIDPLKLIDIGVERNGYGRQFESFVDVGDFNHDGKSEKLEMVFIRAPKIARIGGSVETLGNCRNEVTIIRQGNVIATAFHPELTDSTKFQQYFLSMMT